ncbi:MAG: hypothetical protein GVY27_12980 [Deinococcus-Thermus bacterium]|nr:hypothetical protein [Deinococcota bacterium]
MTSNASLAANRLLLTIYELDLLFLPSGHGTDQWAAFRNFYAEPVRQAAEDLRPTLERCVFGFLDDAVDVTGRWRADDLIAYLEACERGFREAQHGDLALIERCRDPRRAAQTYLIQFASDFLSEASAMARNTLGAYGPLQSELFKILIDEYGYGVHESKHSTLFEATMRSVGLEPEIHRYWQFYLPTSLMLTNYFHHISRDHRYFFRYLGAVFYTEASLVYTTQAQSATLRSVFGDTVDTRYFDEHSHIDTHHGRMALDRLIRPALARFGDAVVPEILRGFEEFRLLEDLASADFRAQIDWADRVDDYETVARTLFGRIESGEIDVPLETFVEVLGERSTTHVHDDHRLLVLESGEMDFWPLYGPPRRYRAGDHMLVPMHRLHGSVVRSEDSVYHQPLVSPDQMARTVAALDAGEPAGAAP